MPGLSPYKRQLAASGTAGYRQQIEVRGSTIFMRRILDGPDGDPTNKPIKLTAHVRSTGEKYTVEIAASEKLFTPREYWVIEIENEEASAQWVELYLGEGDFFRPVPDIVNVAVSVPAARNCDTTVDKTGIGQGNANAVQVLPIDLTRVRASIGALASNADIVRVGDANVDTNQGQQLSAGESMLWESTDACYVCSEGTNNPAVSIVEFKTG